MNVFYLCDENNFRLFLATKRKFLFGHLKIVLLDLKGSFQMRIMHFILKAILNIGLDSQTDATLRFYI